MTTTVSWTHSMGGTDTELITVLDKRGTRPKVTYDDQVAKHNERAVADHLHAAQRDQLAANVRQLAGTTWWAAQSSPTPDDVLATRANLLAKARAEGLDV